MLHEPPSLRRHYFLYWVLQYIVKGARGSGPYHKKLPIRQARTIYLQNLQPYTGPGHHQLPPPSNIQDCRLLHLLLRSIPMQYAREWKKK